MSLSAHEMTAAAAALPTGEARAMRRVTHSWSGMRKVQSSVARGRTVWIPLVLRSRAIPSTSPPHLRTHSTAASHGPCRPSVSSAGSLEGARAFLPLALSPPVRQLCRLVGRCVLRLLALALSRRHDVAAMTHGLRRSATRRQGWPPCPRHVVFVRESFVGGVGGRLMLNSK